MTAGELNNYIFHYLKKDKTQTAIMLTGEWGSGKSYYIENELVPFLKKNGKNTCVVVSLYGIEELSDISKSIYMELRLPTFSKQSESVTTGRIIAKDIIYAIAGKVGISISDSDLKKLYKSIDLRGKLLILEDLERSNIDIIKLLGFVNGLVEYDGVKILLVANENEILKKEKNEIIFDSSSLINEKSEEKEDKTTTHEEDKEYIRIKEKTISDTIQFSGSLNDAIKNIVKNFNNQRLNSLLDDKAIVNLASIVEYNCKRNLRTFIFATQKTVDIYEKLLEDYEYQDDFYLCIFWGILYFSSKIKTKQFPEWEGSKYLSTQLGSNDMPLMRFAYDYIRWQTLNLKQVTVAYEAYKKYRFYEKNAEYNDVDLRILENFAEETEQNVLKALKNIEKKLGNPDSIGIYAYRKLAYYMIYVADVVNFNSEKACKLMIDNAKGKGAENEINSAILFLGMKELEESDVNEKYKAFVSELSEAIDFGKNDISFSYNPVDLKELYNDICKNLWKYTEGHQFISKYNVCEIVKMLKDSTSGQINDFRGILFAVYRNANKGDYTEKDVETLKELFQMVSKTKHDENKWDKIQQLQINYLRSNLKMFIQQMS